MRKTFYLTNIMLVLLLIAGFNVSARERNPGKRQGPGRNPIARILNDSGHPLTQKQKEQLEEIIQPREIFIEVRGILTEEQQQALEQAWEERKAEIKDMPRKGNFIDKNLSAEVNTILENAGFPLTEDQVNQFKSIGFSKKTAIENILTAEQKTALLNAYRLAR